MLNLLKKTTTFLIAIIVLSLFILVPQTYASSKSYYVSPSGSDSNSGTVETSPFKTIQKAVDLAQPGDTINLAPGIYLQDVISKRNGEISAPITIKGSKDAIVKGGGKARVIEINHDYLTLKDFTIDGLHNSSGSISGYRDKLIYLLGKESKSGVTGAKILNMTLKNAGGECIRLRYFASKNEIASNNIQNCGVYDFKFKAGGKNGEGVYIGTAPEQLKDGKNPTSDPDESLENWVHHNEFNTQGNECVDIKEDSKKNIIENNTCTGQKDSDSAGFGSRGDENIFRNNESFGNVGAGVRLGGDTSKDGIKNHVYNNKLYNNQNGGIRFQRFPQGEICGNTFINNIGGDSVGNYGSKFDPDKICPDSIKTLPDYSTTLGSTATSPPTTPSVSPSPNPCQHDLGSANNLNENSISIIKKLLQAMIEYLDSLQKGI